MKQLLAHKVLQMGEQAVLDITVVVMALFLEVEVEGAVLEVVKIMVKMAAMEEMEPYISALIINVITG